MVKIHLLFIIAVISVFLLTLQFLTLQLLIRKVTPTANPIWGSLYAVTNLAKLNDVPLFLIDAQLLGNIVNSTVKVWQNEDHESGSYCRVLCAGQKITHLGTLAEFAGQLQISKLVQHLHEKEYRVLEFKDDDPTLVQHDLRVSIPLHLLIFPNIGEAIDKNSHVIHITVFHERFNSNFWWRGYIELSESDQRLLHKQGVRRAHFKSNDNAALYEKCEILPSIIDGLVIGYPSRPHIFMGDPQSMQFIECNKQRAKKFYSKHPRDESDEATIYRTKAYRLLVKAKQILDELEIPFWLSSGTLLGYYRQCDFISYGRDVDIGIWIKDYKIEMIDAFSIHDMPLLHLFGKPEDSFELSFREGDIKLDVFFFYEEDDNAWNGGTQARTGQKFKYTFPKFDLCWTEFMEQRFRIPCQTEAYIEANYGENWLEVVKEWDWKSSPANVQKNGYWDQNEWDKVIQTFPVPDLN